MADESPEWEKLLAEFAASAPEVLANQLVRVRTVCGIAYLQVRDLRDGIWGDTQVPGRDCVDVYSQVYELLRATIAAGRVGD